jgi:hypothetical protein
MPFVVEQMNLLTLVVAETVLIALFAAVPKLSQEPVTMVIGLSLGFLPLLGALALVPYNPYRGMGGHIEPAEPGDVAVSDRERRLLLAFYQPANRRFAAILILADLVFWLVVWWIGVHAWPTPARPQPVLHGIALIFLIGTTSAAFAGFFGLTRSIRKRWPEIVEEGSAWPQDRKYPGPLRESAISFFSGKLPAFLTDDAA